MLVSKYLVSTNPQKILKFLLLRPGKNCYEREVARGAGISYGSANYVLNRLYKQGFIQKKSEGRMCYYSIDLYSPYIKEFKILNNILLIEPLIEKLKPHTHKIILYGSWAKGTDNERSDIDLFIVTSNKDEVVSIINNYSYSKKVDNRKVQAIINTPVDLLNKNRKEEVYLGQVAQGKILWEKKINEDNF